MAQPPTKVDALQVEPGSGQTLLIERDAATGALKFTDNVVGGGILLNQLAGLRAIGNVFVVGKSGTGAEYTTIQAAHDAVPAIASPTNPYLILVMPGVYEETVNLVRDGIHLIGIGQPVIQEGAANDDHTVVISAQLGTIPQLCIIEGFRITNLHNGKAALRVVGAAASTLLGNSQGLFVHNCTLEGNAAGGNRPLWASTAGQMEFEDCTLKGDVSALVLVQELDESRFYRCEIRSALDFRYDSANDEPAGTSRLLKMHTCEDMGVDTALTPHVNIDCDGAASSTLRSCSMASSARIVFSGDRTHSLRNCSLGVVSIVETPTINAGHTKIESILAANAAAVFKLDQQGGTEAFAAATTAAVTFDIPQPDALYLVALELDDQPANNETAWVTGKLATGFTINFTTNQTLSVQWRANR